MEQMLTTKEAAALLRCSTRSVVRMIQRGDLQASRIANRWIIPQSAVETAIEQATREPDPEAPCRLYAAANRGRPARRGKTLKIV